jgi:hypothetical protein
MNRATLAALIADVTATEGTTADGLSLWLVRRGPGGKGASYDSFVSFVVAATTEEEARLTHPNGEDRWTFDEWGNPWAADEWVWDPTGAALVAQRIGTADVPPGVVTASYLHG